MMVAKTKQLGNQLILCSMNDEILNETYRAVMKTFVFIHLTPGRQLAFFSNYSHLVPIAIII